MVSVQRLILGGTCAGLLLVSACSGKAPESADENRQPIQKPITLKVITYSQSDFDRMITDQVKARFPSITFEAITPNVASEMQTKIKESMMAGIEPDIIIGNTGLIDFLLSIDVARDLNPLIKKQNLDTNTMNDSLLKDAKKYGPNGELFMLPIINVGPFVLMYNKDIFDKFAMPYPHDGMTWDDAFTLASRLTREDSGVQYQGFATPNHAWLNNQLGPIWIDPQTLKARLYTDDWIRIFTVYQRLYALPGNHLIDGTPQMESAFIKDRNIAMLSIPNLWAKDTLKESGVRWDMTTIPVFPDKPKKATPAVFTGATVTTFSKHPDEAFELIRFLVSEEMQRAYAKQSLLTVLNKREIQQSIQENPYLKDKNVEALFKLEAADPFIRTQYDSLVRGPMGSAFLNIMQGKETDVYAALRKAEETVNQAIASANAGK